MAVFWHGIIDAVPGQLSAGVDTWYKDFPARPLDCLSLSDCADFLDRYVTKDL